MTKPITDEELASIRRVLDCYVLDPSTCSLIFREECKVMLPRLLDEVERLRDENHRIRILQGKCESCESFLYCRGCD